MMDFESANTNDLIYALAADLDGDMNVLDPLDVQDFLQSISPTDKDPLNEAEARKSSLWPLWEDV